MARIARVTSKGRITIPPSIRKKYGLKEGTRIAFLESGKELRVLREDDREELFAVFDRARRESKLTRRELARLVKEAKSRLWSERYAPPD